MDSNNGGGAGRAKCAWIFAAGPDAAMPDWSWLPKPDFVVCADGGLDHALRFGLQPTIVLGDFDSLPAAVLAEFRRAHPDADIRTYDHRTKLETDAELALLAALDAGATEVVITGALGGRLDHAVANMLMLGHPLIGRTPCRIVGAQEEVFMLRDRAVVQLWGNHGDIVSLLPLVEPAGVTTGGLEYTLLEDTLYSGLGRGVSNVLRYVPGSVSQREGRMWVVVRHETPVG